MDYLSYYLFLKSLSKVFRIRVSTKNACNASENSKHFVIFFHFNKELSTTSYF